MYNATIVKQQKYKDENRQGNVVAFLAVMIFHSLLFFALWKNGFSGQEPPVTTKGIEVVFEQELPQGFRRNPVQKAVANPPIINAPGNTAPESAKLAQSNQSTKPQEQDNAKASDLSEHGDVDKPAKPAINQRALFQSSSDGDKDAENPNSVSERSLFPGVGNENTATRTANTPVGPEHRQMITANLSGRSVVGALPPPNAGSTSETGTVQVIVEITVNQEGKVTEATATAKGSTTNDSKLWKAAVEAARKARFNLKKDAPVFQTGTITYVFTPR